MCYAIQCRAGGTGALGYVPPPHHSNTERGHDYTTLHLLYAINFGPSVGPVMSLNLELSHAASLIDERSKVS